jgi:hypothetical protein
VARLRAPVSDAATAGQLGVGVGQVEELLFLERLTGCCERGERVLLVLDVDTG